MVITLMDGCIYMLKSDYLKKNIEKEKKDIQFDKNQIIEFISNVITEEKIDINSDIKTILFLGIQ